MIVVDTSVWVDFRRGDPRALPLVELLENNEALVHPFVQGELAMTGLGPPAEGNLASLALLPAIPVVSQAEVLAFVAHWRLQGAGIGWIDAHLAASALAFGATLWTHDGKLGGVAERLGIAHVPGQKLGA